MSSKALSFLKLSVVFFLLAGATLQAKSTRNDGLVVVDRNGVLRFRHNHQEVFGFGVNYTLPFAHEYRMATRLGVSHEEAIRQDVYHFARLGLDLYRVHVWDTEISDTLGNLLQNEHLRLFDFAIYEMKKRGMRFVITPIAYWGNGWPEPDFPTPGFSHRWGKAGCLVNEDCIRAQENFLYQFLNHVNQYTGVAYKNDPSILAFEVSNEPHHFGTIAEVTSFINRMSRSMRRTGLQKPIFYNWSHNIFQLEAFLTSEVQGGTFQWYPTGLVAHHQRKGNFLPQVDYYHIPFANNPVFRQRAKMVYEFDAADTHGSYLIPAMARSFRQAGMQLGAYFAYDAMFNAHYNTNYGTHFMNLAYAPRRALSLKIASEIFRQVPRYADLGKYPDNLRFGNFRLDHEQDLAEMVTNERFIHTNNTNSAPDNPALLREIAGFGSSPLVSYDGLGAYFLDKVEDGIWRLEVMPDAYHIRDPYARASPGLQKAAVVHNQRQMTLKIPNLGTGFSIQPLNEGNRFVPQVHGSAFAIKPGTYLVRRQGATRHIAPTLQFQNIRLNEFVAPASNLTGTFLANYSPEEVVEGSKVTLTFDVFSPTQPEEVEILLMSATQWRNFDAASVRGVTWSVTIPAEFMDREVVSYQVIVKEEGQYVTFPGGHQGRPGQWDFVHTCAFSLRVVPENASMVLWDAAASWPETMRRWYRDVKLIPTPEGNTALRIEIDRLRKAFYANDSIGDYTFKYYFADELQGRQGEFAGKQYLVVDVRTLTNASQPVEVGLIDRNGVAYTAQISIEPGKERYRIPLSSFSQGKYAIIPRPYPVFMAFFHEAKENSPFDWTKLQTLQFSIRESENEKVLLEVERILLE